MTVTDFGDTYDGPHNAQVATAIDTARFWDLVTDAVRALSGADRGDQAPV